MWAGQRFYQMFHKITLEVPTRAKFILHIFASICKHVKRARFSVSSYMNVNTIFFKFVGLFRREHS